MVIPFIHQHPLRPKTALKHSGLVPQPIGEDAVVIVCNWWICYCLEKTEETRHGTVEKLYTQTPLEFLQNDLKLKIILVDFFPDPSRFLLTVG